MSPTINRDLRGTLPYCTPPIPDVGTKYLQLTYRAPFDGIFVTIAPWLDESYRQWSSISISSPGKRRNWESGWPGLLRHLRRGCQEAKQRLSIKKNKEKR